MEKPTIKETVSHRIEEMEPGQYRIVLGSNNIEVGFARLRKLSDERYYVEAFGIKEIYRNKGFGSIMLKKVNDFLDKNNSTGVLNNTSDDETAQIYENNGWVKSDSNLYVYNKKV